MMNINDPVGLDCTISHDKGWFQIAGWCKFLHKFSRYDYGVSHSFVKSFDRNRVTQRNLVFYIT